VVGAIALGYRRARVFANLEAPEDFDLRFSRPVALTRDEFIERHSPKGAAGDDWSGPGDCWAKAERAALAIIRLITLACAAVMAFAPDYRLDAAILAGIAIARPWSRKPMTLLEKLVDQFLEFPRGTSARAMLYLRTGVLEGNANPRMQAVLDGWVDQVERANLRMAILRALEEPAKGRAEIEPGTDWWASSAVAAHRNRQNRAPMGSSFSSANWRAQTPFCAGSRRRF
jgi:hypothetical protein